MTILDNIVVTAIITAIVSTFFGFLWKRLSRYFDQKEELLKELLNKIHEIELSQSEKHARQDMELHKLKVIVNEHDDNIDELYDITNKHQLAIEIIKGVDYGTKD